MKKKLVLSFVAILLIASVVMLSIPPKTEAWSDFGEAVYSACMKKCYLTGLEVDWQMRAEFRAGCDASCEYFRCVL